MVDRLVLGCSGLGRRIVGHLTDRPENLCALVDDDDERSWLSERRVDVIEGDPADVPTLEQLDTSPDSVVIAAAAPQRIRAIAAAATTAFTPPPVYAVVPFDASVHLHTSLPDAVEVVDPTEIVGGVVLDLVGGELGERVQRFRRTLLEIEEPLAVVMHDNPDPDAIASAVALTRIATKLGVEATPCYFGEINHQENRALVNLLDFDLTALDTDDSLDSFGGIALVDHGRAGVNNQLDPETPIDIVIDHHPPTGPMTADFVDLQIGVGSTSTILTDYFDRLGVVLEEAVATALLYGIRTDTDDFTREVATADFEAAARLCQSADASVLERVESPSISGETLGTLARAIQRRSVRSTVLTSCVGEVADPDSLAQAADQLLQLEGVKTTFVYGIVDDTVYGSARTTDNSIDLGATLRGAFDQIGSAGGHSKMAGAQIPIGILADSTDRDSLAETVEGVIDERFYEELGVHPRHSDRVPGIADTTLSFLSTSDQEVDDDSTTLFPDE